jgi:hypothetical protein
MEKDKNFIKEQTENVKGLFRKTKDLYVNNKRKFYLIATKTVFAFLFWISILLPSFGKGTANANVFDLRLSGLWFTLFLVLPFVFAILSILEKEKLAGKIFKIGTIVAIVFVGFTLLTYIVVVIDPSLITPNLKLGFFLEVIFLVTLSLLVWRVDTVMNLVYKIFKVSELEEVEYVKEPVSEPAEE